MKNKKIVIDFKLITTVTIIAALLIMIISNLKINGYTKNFIIPFSITIISYIFIIYKLKLQKNKKSYILLIPIILILISNILMKIDISNKILNIIILLIIIPIFFLILTNPNYTISRNSFLWIFKLFPNSLFKNLKGLKMPIDIKDNNKKNKILNILKGFLIGIPIAIFLLVLLSQADKYFSIFIGEILKFTTSSLSIKKIIINLIILAISIITIFSVFINILKNRESKMKKVCYYEINKTTVSTILIIINIVFALFLVSEISKITTNFLSLPVEYTYAGYAREGFFQLLWVTIINFGIISYFLYYTDVIKNNKTIKRLLLLLIVFSVFLIFNSYYRMFLYISAYEFTILRLQVILFLAMELILFIILFKKIIKELKHQDSIIFTIVILVTYIANIYLCTDTFINFINKLL